MEGTTYIYARLGHGDRTAVLRLPVEVGEAAYPGGDCPTTRSVGPLVFGDVELDESGHTVLIALDSRRPPGDAGVAVEEGWQQPPPGDPWVPRVHETNGRSHDGADVATSNQGESA
jgi:hypothetical protein